MSVMTCLPAYLLENSSDFAAEISQRTAPPVPSPAGEPRAEFREQKALADRLAIPQGSGVPPALPASPAISGSADRFDAITGTPAAIVLRHRESQAFVERRDRQTPG